MPRVKRKSLNTIARKTAARRNQETPEQRAARLESMRNYARYCRENETESEREERLESTRHYAKLVRERQKAEMRKQRLALIIERCQKAHNSDTTEEIE